MIWHIVTCAIMGTAVVVELTNERYVAGVVFLVAMFTATLSRISARRAVLRMSETDTPERLRVIAQTDKADFVLVPKSDLVALLDQGVDSKRS